MVRPRGRGVPASRSHPGHARYQAAYRRSRMYQTHRTQRLAEILETQAGRRIARNATGYFQRVPRAERELPRRIAQVRRTAAARTITRAVRTEAVRNRRLIEQHERAENIRNQRRSGYIHGYKYNNSRSQGQGG